MTNNDCIIQTESLQTLADVLKTARGAMYYILSRLSGENKEKVTELVLDDDITSISAYAFDGYSNLIINKLPDSITSICEGAFRGCGNLSLINIPLKITKIEDYAFQNAKLLISTLPEGITSIGFRGLSGCIDSSVLTLPSTLDTIHHEGIATNPKLESLFFKGTVTNINNIAFISCQNLTDIYVPWAEGEVANAPWGATNATIHYNYIAEE